MQRGLTFVAGFLITSLFALLNLWVWPWPFNLGAASLVLVYFGIGGLIQIPIGFRGVTTLFGGRLVRHLVHTRQRADGTEESIKLVESLFELREGWNWILPRPLMAAEAIDTREQSLQVPSFTVISQAPANVRITVPKAVIRYLIVNPAQSLSVSEAVIRQSLIELIQQVFRARIRELDEQVALNVTEQLRSQLEKLADEQATAWGVDVRQVLLGELALPPEVQADYENVRREERQREAERIELAHVGARITELQAMGYSPEQALEIVQTERGKVKKEIREIKGNLSTATGAVLQAIAETLRRP